VLFISGVGTYFLITSRRIEQPITKEEVVKNIQELKKELEEFELANNDKTLPGEFYSSKKKLDQAIDCTIAEEDYIKSFKLLSESRQEFSEAKLILAKQDKTPSIKSDKTVSETKPVPKPKPETKPKPKPEPEPKPETPTVVKDYSDDYSYPLPVVPAPVVSSNSGDSKTSIEEMNKKAIEERNKTSTENTSSEYTYKPLTKKDDSKSKTEEEKRDDTSSTPSPSSSPGGKVNLNTATSEELQTLKGIGPSKASAIIEYRSQNGPFKRIEDIQNVSGIGPKTFETLKPYITVGSDDKVSVSDKPSHSSNDIPAGKKLNVNTASADELDDIPGIGPKTAQSIIEYREQNGPFKSLDELDNIPRIGPKTLEKIKPYLTIGE
ncbi:MAG TPA: helix-hairpin-helix domain-containing protein, partial [Firmicutes bacterium]|nr:helix-hairpin-helix domain-containing protein [Bacillota bacterium]